ncbi:unnamed protein product [Aphanomyces euteiches]|nr:hypothetical protein AeRB84_017687 [Aphanomyces euteiches]
MVFRVAAPHLEAEDNDGKANNRVFDIMSHEIIEQRLENLKRKPKLTEWLDAYVNSLESTNSRDDDDDEWMPRGNSKGNYTSRSKSHAGFISHLFWSITGIVLSPFIVLFCVPFKRFYAREMWPLGCSSPLDFIYQIAINITTIALILVVAYWNLCGEMPTSNLDLNISLIKQHAAILLTKGQHCVCRVEVANDFTTKTLVLIQTFIEGGHYSPASWPVSVDVECLGPFVEAFVALSFGILLLQFYQRWSRFAIFLLASIHIFLSSSYAQLYLSPRPSISSIDAEYAMLDEELVVGIEGVHLQAGGSIAWIPSWCAESTYASSSFVGDCTKQFESTYQMGVVHVTFKLLDTFIPCYKAPPNPLRAQDFHCFDAHRIRVKDRESIPGLPKQLSPAPNEPLSTPPTDPPLVAPIQPFSAGPMQPTSSALMISISSAPIQPVSASPVEHLTVEVAADGDLESPPKE